MSKYKWSTPGVQDVMCVVCGEQTPNHDDGRPRLYCSNKCRQKAYRSRQSARVCHRLAWTVGVTGIPGMPSGRGACGAVIPQATAGSGLTGTNCDSLTTCPACIDVVAALRAG